MITKNPMQLKAFIKKKAKGDVGISTGASMTMQKIFPLTMPVPLF